MVSISAGMKVRVRKTATVCPGRLGTVGKHLPGANRKKAEARGLRWFVDLEPKNPRRTAPRIELFWGDELEPVEVG
jgi:hypothetical protein